MSQSNNVVMCKDPPHSSLYAGIADTSEYNYDHPNSQAKGDPKSRAPLSAKFTVPTDTPWKKPIVGIYGNGSLLPTAQLATAVATNALLHIMGLTSLVLLNTAPAKAPESTEFVTSCLPRSAPIVVFVPL